MKTICTLLLAMLLVGCGSYKAPATLAAPVISTLTPASAAALGPQFTLTVDGSGFAATSLIYFNAAAQPTMFVSAKQLTAVIPASAIATAGAKPVKVVTPGGGYGGNQNSNSMTFTVN